MKGCPVDSQDVAIRELGLDSMDSCPNSLLSSQSKVTGKRSFKPQALAREPETKTLNPKPKP